MGFPWETGNRMPLFGHVRIVLFSSFLIVFVCASLHGEGISMQSSSGTTAYRYPPVSTSELSEINFDLREDIARAQEILRHKKSGYSTRVETSTISVTNRRGRVREKIIRTKVIDPTFLLAVEDITERRIQLVRFTVKGCETPGFDIVMTRKNGVGSRFKIREPENMVLLALRTTVRAEKKGYEEVVYTPYSPEIDTAEIREDGLGYLRQQIESARADLEDKNIQLKAFDALSGDYSATDISLVLSIIEHIDPLRFETAPPGGETLLVHEVLTIIGANKGNAYAYSKSSAGARGLFQFIPGTYEKMLRKYPNAGLHRSFVAGCKNHVNAAKASLLLFDSDFGDLPGDYRRALGQDIEAVGRYLAAAYNCGSRRVERSVKNCTEGWTCLLPQETKVYLRKFDAVWNMKKPLHE
jgi:hypothetical protein